jgi:hypothetical protein
MYRPKSKKNIFYKLKDRLVVLESFQCNKLWERMQIG